MVAGLVVLDAWPLMRYRSNEEPSADAVRQILEQDIPVYPIVNVVTLSEVYTAIARNHDENSAARFVSFLQQSLLVETVDSDLAVWAARIKTRYYMSLGDSYAAASAMSNDAVLWTGDAELLFAGCPWKINDLRDEITLQHHEAAIKTGIKKVGLRTGRTPAVDW